MLNLTIFIISISILIAVINIAIAASYKKLLVMKAEDKTAECINGKFYYIVPEDEYVRKINS